MSANAKALFREHGGILRTGQAVALGIHPRTLYQLRDSGEIERISRGVYRIASLPPLAYPDLVTVALRAPRAVVCLVSALSYHEITSEVPHAVYIALPRGTKTPRIEHPPMRVFRFSGSALTTGVLTETLDGIEVKIYSAEKTVADCFRFRNRIGTDVAVEALTLCLRRGLASPAALLSHARICGVERVMMPYLEALQ